MLDPAIGTLLLGCFALLFASAALPKLRAPAHFGEVLRAYRVMPDRAARLALLVPLFELGVALALLIPPARAGAALAGAGLLLAYAAAIAVNLKRGRRDLACGCGGADEARPIAPWMVARNLLLASSLAATLLPWQSRELQATDMLTVAGGMAVATLLYVSLDRLLGRVALRARALGDGR
jgi:hypothetical protein